MKKKALLFVLAAAILVVASVGGTLAWLKDSQSVTNTFTVGNLDITLTEPDWVPGAEHVIAPNVTFAKDPTVTLVAGKADTDIYMTVTLAPSIKTLVADHKITFTMGTGWTWDDTNKCYKFDGPLTAGETNPLFTEVKFLDTLTNADLAALRTAAGEGGTLGITLMAYAKQSDAPISELAIAAGDKIN